MIFFTLVVLIILIIFDLNKSNFMALTNNEGQGDKLQDNGNQLVVEDITPIVSRILEALAGLSMQEADVVLNNAKVMLPSRCYVKPKEHGNTSADIKSEVYYNSGKTADVIIPSTDEIR
jgi:hypothetical protein